MSVSTVSVERHDLLSARPFDDVLQAVLAGLGHPDFPRLAQRLEALKDWGDYTAAVAAETGSAGLMVFLRLDVDSVLAVDPNAQEYRCVRIIAGNPVTMAAMTRTTPQAAAFAPVTILLFEAADGTHCRYDTMISAAGPELTDDAAVTAHALDAEVLDLLRSATGAAL